MGLACSTYMSLEYIKALYNRLITKKETGSMKPHLLEDENPGNLILRNVPYLFPTVPKLKIVDCIMAALV